MAALAVAPEPEPEPEPQHGPAQSQEGITAVVVYGYEVRTPGFPGFEQISFT